MDGLRRAVEKHLALVLAAALTLALSVQLLRASAYDIDTALGIASSQGYASSAIGLLLRSFTSVFFVTALVVAVSVTSDAGRGQPLRPPGFALLLAPALLVSPWPLALAGVLAIGLAVALRIWSARWSALRISIYSLSAVGFLGAWFTTNEALWLNPEALTVRPERQIDGGSELVGEQEIIGYVLGVDGDWTMVLRRDDRRLLPVLSAEVVTRRPCSVDRPLLDQTLVGWLFGPEEPFDVTRCEQPPTPEDPEPTEPSVPTPVDVLARESGSLVLLSDGSVEPQNGASYAGAPIDDLVGDAAFLVPAGADGFWIVSDAGDVRPVGSAPAIGDLVEAGISDLLNAPLIGAAGTQDGRGLYLVAADGAVFAFGTAPFLGSMGGIPLNSPIVSFATDPDGSGYWMLSADGGIFAFDAQFLGSMGATPLELPLVEIVPFGDGYLLIAGDGGIFVFSALEAFFFDTPELGDPPAVIAADAIDDRVWLLGSTGQSALAVASAS